LVLEFLTFLGFGYPYQTAASLLEVFAATLFEGLYAQLPTVLNDFYVPITDWEVLTLDLLRLLILITLKFFCEKSTDAAIFLLVAHHSEIIVVDLILFILLDN